MHTPRRIIVTGCSRGLGRALTEAFIAAGHTVAGISRTPEATEAMTEAFDAPHIFKTVDVSNVAEVNVWSKNLLQTFGTPDLLINNAAIINRPQPLWQTSPEDFANLTAININGIHNVIHAILPAMLELNEAVVVNLSSGWGRSVSPDVAPYCASKWAVEGMTKALAEELPAGFAAIPLSPGIIDTDMLRGAWGDSAAAFRTPKVWAKKAAPYILSLNSEHNGQSLTTPE